MNAAARRRRLTERADAVSVGPAARDSPRALPGRSAARSRLTAAPRGGAGGLSCRATGARPRR